MPMLARLYARVAPARIHYLKFILEGYDGLTTLSTADRKQGVVRLLFPGERRTELLALLDDLEPWLAP